MNTTPERWRATCSYLNGTFGTLDTQPAGQTLRSHAARRRRRHRRSRRYPARPGARCPPPALADFWGPRSIDMAFLDTEKTEYPDYLRLIRPLLRVGGLIVADNALGSGSWWITEPAGALDHQREQARTAAAAFNRTLADDPGFDTVALPIRQGVLVAVRMNKSLAPPL